MDGCLDVDTTTTTTTNNNNNSNNDNDNNNNNNKYTIMIMLRIIIGRSILYTTTTQRGWFTEADVSILLESQCNKTFPGGGGEWNLSSQRRSITMIMIMIIILAHPDGARGRNGWMDVLM